jgi:hypothetical protein
LSEQKSSYWGRLGRALLGSEQKYTDQLHDLGFHSVISPFFSWRTEVLLHGTSVVDDRLLDIADRVDQAALLTTSIGLPFARAASGGNAAFLQAYSAMRDKLSDPWTGDIGMRSWYRSERLAKVRDYFETPEVDQETGKVLVKQVEHIRYLHEDTLALRQKLDEKQLEEKTRPEGWKKIEFVQWVEKPMQEGASELFKQLGFSEEATESRLRLEGEELVAEIMGFTLPLAWHDRDTPYMSGNVIFLSNQNQDQRTRMEYPGQTVPETSASLGVHK